MVKVSYKDGYARYMMVYVITRYSNAAIQVEWLQI